MDWIYSSVLTLSIMAKEKSQEQKVSGAFVQMGSVHGFPSVSISKLSLEDQLFQQGFCQTSRWNSLPHLRRPFTFHSCLRLLLESICARHPAATHFSNSSPQNIPRGRQSSLYFATDIRGLAGEISNWPKILELTQGAGNTVTGSSGGGWPRMAK